MPRKKTNINVRLLSEVLSVPTKSKDDALMLNYIKQYLNYFKLPYTEDSYGNIYVIKGNKESFPCIVAHTDTVHEVIKPEDFKVFNIANSYLYAMNLEEGRQIGIGGDDKVGVYIALQALQDLKHVKVVFFRDEEIGRLGSRYSILNNKDFYNDCNFVLQADRKGNSDFITTSGGIKMASLEFENAVNKYLVKYGYSIQTGICTDVDTLVANHIGVSCANISCGYYRPHTSTEIVDIRNVETAYNLMLDICRDLGQNRFEFKHVAKTYAYESEYSSSKSTALKGIYNNRNTYVTKFPDYLLEPDNKYKGIFAHVQVGRGYSIFYENLSGSILEKTYVLNKDINLIHLEDETCTECHKKDTIYYVIDEDSFYCIGCNQYISAGEDALYYKKMRYKVNNELFVYDSWRNVWYKEGEAVWSERDTKYTLKIEITQNSGPIVT